MHTYIHYTDFANSLGSGFAGDFVARSKPDPLFFLSMCFVLAMRSDSFNVAMLRSYPEAEMDSGSAQLFH